MLLMSSLQLSSSTATDNSLVSLTTAPVRNSGSSASCANTIKAFSSHLSGHAIASPVQHRILNALCDADWRAGLHEKKAGSTYKLLDHEQAMLLDTWYTVMAYSPQCTALLRSSDSVVETLVWAEDDGTSSHTAQLTLGAIAAQVGRIQLHLKATGHMLQSPFLCDKKSSAAFAKWLHIFHQEYLQKSQVWHTAHQSTQQ